MQTHDFILFALASLMLNITPGVDMIYVASRSTAQGVKAGMISALGIAAGCMFHISAAAFGLYIIIMQSAWFFNLIKYSGALYLIYLGIKSLTSHSYLPVNQKKIEYKYFKIFIQGAYTNIFNPKVALFFLAFLPQFINSTGKGIVMQTLLLGLWFNFSGLIVNLMVAELFGRSGEWLKRFAFFKKIQEKLTGCVLIWLGCRIMSTK